MGLSILVSMQRALKGDGHGGVKFDVATELSWSTPSTASRFASRSPSTETKSSPESPSASINAPDELNFNYQASELPAARPPTSPTTTSSPTPSPATSSSLSSRDVHGSDRIGLWSDRIKTIGYPRIRRSDPKFRIVD